MTNYPQVLNNAEEMSMEESLKELEHVLLFNNAMILDISALMFLGNPRSGETYLNGDEQFLVPALAAQLLEDRELADELSAYYGAMAFLRAPAFDFNLFQYRFRNLRNSGRVVEFAASTAFISNLVSMAVTITGRLDRAAEFSRNYIIQTLSRSFQTGNTILMKTRRLPTLIREHIAVLELPSRADSLIDRKAEVGRRIFGFRGGRAVKFFVGIAISTIGIPNPIMGAGGVLFAFIDP